MAKKRKRRSRRRQVLVMKRNLILLGTALVVAGVLFGGIEFSLRRAVKKRDDGTILQGVSVGHIDVSGLTKKSALEKVEVKLEESQGEKISLQLESGDVVETTLGELAMEPKELKKTIESAERYGKTGGAFSAYRTIRTSEKGKLEHQIPLKLAVSKEMVKNILEERSKEYLSLPINASVTQQDGVVTVIPEQKGEVPDVEAAFKELKKKLNGDWNGKGFSLAVAVKKTDPEITKEKLKDMTDLLGTFTTYYGADGSGRSINVETGANHINGIFMEPGKQISANALMEPYTYENGYEEAASFEKNKVVSSMGGGICQVSTTLYNALLFAELEIVERYPHSMRVGYADVSKDAAIAENLLDLVFQNNLEYPVYIESVLSGGNITFNIYGKETRNPNRTLEFVSEVTGTTESTAKEYVATDEEIGSVILTTEPQPQVTAQLWKVVYEDGVEVSREIINYSTYISAPAVYNVGTHCEDPALTEKMQAAIKSQSETAVQAVIDEYQKKKSESEAQKAAEQAAQATQ